jgi:hypothetical protein
MHHHLLISIGIILICCTLRICGVEDEDMLLFGLPKQGLLSNQNKLVKYFANVDPNETPRGDTILILYISVILNTSIPSDNGLDVVVKTKTN